MFRLEEEEVNCFKQLPTGLEKEKKQLSKQTTTLETDTLLIWKSSNRGSNLIDVRCVCAE